MKAVGPRDRRSWKWSFALVLGMAVLLLAGVFWISNVFRDPFHGLEDKDHDQPHNLAGAAIADLPPGLTPAEQLRRLDEQLRNDPNNPVLLAAKIHLGLEAAPSVAAEECRRILQQSPDNYFALHHAAMAYLAMTNLDRAMYYAAQALQTRDTIEARFVAGHIFYAKGDFPGALRHYRAILEKNPQDETARGFVERTERAMAARR